MEIKSLSNLKLAMETKSEGRKKYRAEVYNKMKPKWLFAQVASHPLEYFWVIWIDEDITDNTHIANIKPLSMAGFDLFPF